MAWGAVDDGLHCHTKTAKAGLEAMGLWVVCASWANDNLTDGFVPFEIIERYAGSKYKATILSKRLVSCGRPGQAGFWEPVEGGFMMHDFHDFNRSREKILSAREKWKSEKTKYKGKNSTRLSNSSTPESARIPPYPIPIPNSPKSTDTETERRKSTEHGRSTELRDKNPSAPLQAAGQENLPGVKLASTPPTETPSPPRKRREQRVPDENGNQALIAYYCDRWKEQTGSTAFPLVVGKDAGAAARLVKQFGIERAKALVDRFFEDRDPALTRTGYPLSFLQSRINGWIADGTMPEKPEQPNEYRRTQDEFDRVKSEYYAQKATARDVRRAWMAALEAGGDAGGMKPDGWKFYVSPQDAALVEVGT